MMNNLEKIKVSNDCINNICKLVDSDVILSINNNYDLINKNIDLLQSYGIENIDEIFLNKYYIFLKETERLVKGFSKFNIPVLVNIINEDYNTIDEIL